LCILQITKGSENSLHFVSVKDPNGNGIADLNAVYRDPVRNFVNAMEKY